MIRVLDVFLSLVAILVLLPLFVVVIVILRCTGEGDVFYFQRRVGRGGKPFKLFKFVTMRRDSERVGTGTITLKGDPRVLPFGRFLRKTKINELPQLMNIVIGDMSVVGPRPQTQRCFDAFPPEAQEAIKRVRPGLTGLGSVVFRNEEELLADRTDSAHFYDEAIAPYKGQIEIWFTRNSGLGTYVKLIFLTAWVVVFPSSRLVWRMFPSIPRPPAPLDVALT